ncbi:MAG: electron transport complex subunit RsxC [Succinivibrio sp.]|nr:electron transport complex subunit RsxC [Succinivibrio sp.]MCI7773186.1 electron transport complex subunit RsxC [Succinivibrio sp.]
MATPLLQKIANGKIWKFFGGIKPQELKDTSNCVIETLKIPSLITIPLSRHLGPEGEILVNVGDHVKRGQPLTVASGRYVPVHASTSGTISAISKEVLPHPSGYTDLCISIKPDGLDESEPYNPISNWESVDNNTLLERIRSYGIEGLGGAVFQTEAKLRSALDDAKDGCKVLIINGCECEPAITCDDRIMQEQATDIAKGIAILNKILKPTVTVVAIEDNKQKAIQAMDVACKGVATVRVIPTIYPSGAARNLIKIITGIEVPYNVHTSECGIVVDNVGTVLAVKEAIIDGKPLTERVITVTGDNFKHQGNVRVRLGTSVRFILSNFGLNPEYHQRVILGGPMMGFTLPTIDVPITKAASCVLAPSSKQIPKLKQQTNCIRCGRCARVCPSRLVPYQMYSQSKASNHAAAQKCGIKDCTLCGACAYVCPSFIPLTAQFRYEKAVEKHIYEAEKRNARAKERMAAKQQRLHEEELARQKKKEEALARIKAQKEAEAKMTPEELQASRQKALEEAKAKAKARKEAILKGATTPLSGEVNDESQTVERIKNQERKAIEISKHEGHMDNPLAKARLEQEALAKKQQLEKEAHKNDLPFNLRRQAAVRTDTLNIKYYEEVVDNNTTHALVGLEPNDALQNPERKKPVAQVLMSAQFDKKVENNKLPEVLKKKTLRSKK